MAKNLYANLQVVFPELKQIALPEELDNFESLRAWLNHDRSNLQRIDAQDLQAHGIDECYRLQQLNLDIEELKSEIYAEIQGVQALYDDTDEPTSEQYQTELDEHVVLNTLQAFVEPYDLVVLAVEFNEIYWMLVPNQQELINAIIAGFTRIFGDEHVILQLE